MLGRQGKTYKARGIDGYVDKAGTGTEYVAIKLRVTNGDETDSEITWFGYFTDKTIDRTIESLRILGWRGDDLSDLAGITENEVEIVVRNEEYEGQTRARVAFINRIGGGVRLEKRMSAEDTRRFAARMKAKVAAVTAGMDQQPGRDKDIPF